MGIGKFVVVILGYVLAAIPSLAAAQESTALPTQEDGPYASSIAKQIFAETLEAQEIQLKNNPLMRRFAEARARMASDPYRPIYHFVSPGGDLNGPNGLSRWQGRWHLFYQVYFSDEESAILGRGWGHAVSDDLVHWRDLPYANYPGVERVAFSGSTVVEKDRVVAFYPGKEIPGSAIPGHPERKSGQMVGTSSDPLLLNWRKIGPVNTEVGDADIWKEGDIYFGLIGGMNKYYPEAKVPIENRGGLGSRLGLGTWPKLALWTSKDLLTWKHRGELLFENTPFTDRFGDGACPKFLKIGDKNILLYFSHINGGQYLLGDYNEQTNKFRPYDHGRFNHGQVVPGGIHAPSGSEDGVGGVISIFNINEGKKEWDRIMSLPQQLTLGEDKRLRMEPVEALATLRGGHQQVGETIIPTDRELVLPAIKGNAMELSAEIDTRESHWVQLNVLRSPDAEEQTSITFYNLHTPNGIRFGGRINEEVVLDSSRSTILPDVVPRSPEKAVVERRGENLKVRVFIDRSVVEVFVNGQQYLAMRVYPGRKDSSSVSLRAHGQHAVLKKLDAWQMQPIRPVADK